MVAALLGIAAGAGAQSGSTGFTPAERRALLSGDLVRRPVARREGHRREIGGTSFQRVDAPRARVFAAARTVENYPRLIPSVVEARVVEEHDDERVVFLRHRYSLVNASYYARVRVDEEAHTIHFELDRSRPHDVRDGRGFITVDSYRGDESIVTWGVMADVGRGLLSGVFAPVIQDWILKVPWCVRGFVEPGQPGC